MRDAERVKHIPRMNCVNRITSRMPCVSHIVRRAHEARRADSSPMPPRFWRACLVVACLRARLALPLVLARKTAQGLCILVNSGDFAGSATPGF
jgi:hypothetical protein